MIFYICVELNAKQSLDYHSFAATTYFAETVTAIYLDIVTIDNRYTGLYMHNAHAGCIFREVFINKIKVWFWDKGRG